MLQHRIPDTLHSVLHSAVMHARSVQTVCKLLKLGANPHWVDSTGQTPAELARARGQTLVARILERAAQDVVDVQ